MIKEIEYNEVFDAQEHFRTLMDGFSRPGSIHSFEAIKVDLPQCLYASTAYVALALLNTDVTCAVYLENEKTIKEYLSINTNVGFEAVDKANFLLTSGSADSQLIDCAYEGDPAYPETSCFVVLQVEEIANTPFQDAIGVELTGPGIQTSQQLYVKGISEDMLAAIQLKNSEYPLGVEIILCASNGEVSVIPRSSKITNLKKN